MGFWRVFSFFYTIAIAAVVTIAAGSESVSMKAPDGTTVTIRRDAFGVPHIKGDSEVAVVFAQGFAVAQDRLDQLDNHRRLAEGRLSEVLGSFALALDMNARSMYYTKEENTELFERLPSSLQMLLQAYADGINTYVDSMEVNPEKYKPLQFKAREMERWTVENTIATMSFLVRNFGSAGGRELERLEELQNNGWEWLDENRPINDPEAPTTIPNGAPAPERSWDYGGMRVRDAVFESIRTKQEDLNRIATEINAPQKFGSFAVLAASPKTEGDEVLLLGCPQMGEPEKNTVQITHEVELDCPSFHAGGMTVAGVPLVIIGHTEHHAWSFTSGASDNVDVYIDSTMDESFSKYYHRGEWLDFQVIQDTIQVVGSRDAVLTHYRTIHGPVFEADLENRQVFSKKMTFWKQEVDMAVSVFGMIKAESLAEFEAAAAINPMSFNLFYADKDQNIKFWHIGKYQDRSDGIDPRLPHSGTGDEEWGGFRSFADLPQLQNPEQGYLVNWNNKPVNWWDNGDNIAWHGSTSQTIRVTRIDDFLKSVAAFNYDHLKDVPKQINSHGTYQQAIALSATEIIDSNIVPPGQSGFINLNNERSPHYDDQWQLHTEWKFKDMEFGEVATGVSSETDQTPLSFTVYQNYPNPFNPVTTISYELPQPDIVRLSVFNLNGQLVATLIDEHQNAGKHEITWRPDHLSSGTYLYKIEAGDFVQVRKAVLLK